MKIALATAGVLALAAAGCGASAVAAPTADPAAADVTLRAVADRLEYDTTELTAAAGEIVMSLTCEGRTAHDVVVETTGEDVRVAVCADGATSAGTVELDPGTYTYYCSIPGHRRTMEGTLSVR